MTQDIDPYKIATEIRNFEIKLFWQRSNYFLVLSTAIATGTFLVKEHDHQILLAIFGFIVSVLWFRINLGGKYWQGRWEAKLSNIEGSMNHGYFFTKKRLRQNERYIH